MQIKIYEAKKEGSFVDFLLVVYQFNNIITICDKLIYAYLESGKPLRIDFISASASE